MSYSSIIKELEASRRLNSELALERQQHELQRTKIQKELESLRQSRKNYINGQVVKSKLQYQEKLKEDTEVSEEHLNRKKRAAAERAKMAQLDFEKERERLLEQRNNYDNLDKQFRLIDKALNDIQLKSRLAQEEEDRKTFELNTRKSTILKLLQQSKRREMYHYEQSKRLSVF